MAASIDSDGTGIMATCKVSTLNTIFSEMLHILGGVLGQLPPPAKYTLPMSADFPHTEVTKKVNGHCVMAFQGKYMINNRRWDQSLLEMY